MKKALPLLLIISLLLSGCRQNSAPNTENTTETTEHTAEVSQTEAVSAETGTSANNGTTASVTTATSSEADTSAPSTDAVQTDKPQETVNNNSSPDYDEKLSADSKEYEGRKQSSDYNYGEALQKSILFYDLQRSGDLPDNFRSNWRGDSCLKDGQDVGLDLSGGFFDAGDNVKFNLPMAYTTSVLAWSVIEDKAAYEESGQLQYILDNIRWGNDYFIKCHPEANVYYYQVGDGNADHGWWGAAECVETQMNRPSYKVDLNNGGSTVAAGTAASLASCAVVFKDSDPSYSELCIKHAKELFDYAEKVKNDSGYTAANGFYNSHSGYVDELAFSAFWLYKATGDSSYLEKSKSYYGQSGGDYTWAFCWDDKSFGTALLLAVETGEQTYKDKIEQHLDYWNSGIKYTPKGMAWLDQWGALRYSTTTAFLAAVYADSEACPAAKKDIYHSFAKKQIDYALGSSGRSYVCGFGVNPPLNPHHRTAHGSATNNIGEPSNNLHTLYGALVGGPDSNDGYSDDRSNYINNEVACDYNAGFTGALAKLYKAYGGETLKNFGAIETPSTEELYADAGVNVNGQDFIEIKALVYNKTTTPARNTDNLKLCYFFDLSEIIAAGGSPSDITVSTNYMQGGTASGVNCWNEEKNLYYVAIDFTGVNIYPGGQDAHKKEVQFRIKSNNGIWDNSNDPSYIDVASVSGGTLTKAYNMALYEGSTLVFGTEPNEKNTGTAIADIISKPQNNNNNNNNSNNNNNGGNNNNTAPTAPVSDKGTVSVELSQQATGGNGNTIAFTLKIKNTGTTGIDLSKLTADYFFTKDGTADLSFWCDYADISGSSYQACTESISGSFSAENGDNKDTKCTIKGSGVLSGGDTLQIQVRITKSDWSEFNLGNDYSAGNADNIKITYNGKEL